MIIDDKLKEQIMQAFDEGVEPVDAVIRFEVVPEVIMALYEDYHRSKGGMVFWGDQMREFEKMFGLEPGSINSSKAFVDAVLALKREVDAAKREMDEFLLKYKGEMQ
jgi:hypothetical protein